MDPLGSVVGMADLSNYLGAFLIILLLTSFVKFFTTLQIARVGLGLEAGGFGLITFGLALALSLTVIDAKWQAMGGVNGVVASPRAISDEVLQRQVTPFLQSRASPELVERLGKIASPKGEPSFYVLLSSFLLSELKAAFEIGLLVLIPFVVIDLLVVNVLMSLGVSQISSALVSLPLKILIFFAIDGWRLLGERLLSGYLQ